MVSIEWTRKAEKQLGRLDRGAAAKIVLAVRTLRDWPGCRNVKALSGRDDYRRRVGDYRVIFTVHAGQVVVVRVEEVKKRDEATYQ